MDWKKLIAEHMVLVASSVASGVPPETIPGVTVLPGCTMINVPDLVFFASLEDTDDAHDGG